MDFYAYSEENVCMKTAEERNRCFTDFIKGMSLKTIADKYGFSKRTLERWCAHEQWVIHRQRAWSDAKDAIMKDFATNKRNSDILATEALFDLLRHAVAEQRAFREGRIPRKAMKYSLKNIVTISKALYHANFAERLNCINSEAPKIEDF